MAGHGKIGPIYIHKLANNLTGSQGHNLYQRETNDPFNPTLRYDGSVGNHLNDVGEVIITPSGDIYAGGTVVGNSGRYNILSQSGEFLDFEGNVVLSFSGSYTGHSNRTAVSTNYTSSKDDVIIAIIDTSLPRGISINSSMVKEGREITIKDESGNAFTNNITIKGQGGENFDGAVSLVINTDRGFKKLYCDGANWQIIGSS